MCTSIPGQQKIHWADNWILFRASKNDKDSVLPLHLQVGESLLYYHSQTRLLEYFDRFLVQNDFNRPPIIREITDSCQRGLILAPRTQSNHTCVMLQFCQYLASSDPQSYVPRPLQMIRSHQAHQPYIYNSRQLRVLLAAGSRLLPLGSLWPHTYCTLLGLLYTTCIRIGEAMGLNLEDVKPDTQLIADQSLTLCKLYYVLIMARCQ